MASSSSSPPRHPGEGPGEISPWTWACSGWQEFRAQAAVALPLSAMNLMWFAKIGVTTAFLGRLGDLALAGGTLGLTFANVTGFSVLTGLCGAMEPICGQAFGAGNYRLLHRTLFMEILLLLVVSIPISLVWVYVDRVLLLFGQNPDIARVAKKYVVFLIPDLVVTSFLLPLKGYFSSQAKTTPIMVTSGAALSFHVVINFFLSRNLGLRGPPISVWVTDLIVVVMLACYVAVSERKRAAAKSFRFSLSDWSRLLRLSAPCCLTTCLEWWCIEILVMLAGRLQDSRRAVSVLAVVFNFDYLLFSVMISLATCASTRVSNELGAGRGKAARASAIVALLSASVAGVVAAAAMMGMRGPWGVLFTRDRETLKGVRKTMCFMAAVEIVNFPLGVAGGVVRGTARPWLGMYASLVGFYVVGLPSAILFSFKLRFALSGLILGLILGSICGLGLIFGLLSLIDWENEARKARLLAGDEYGVLVLTPPPNGSFLFQMEGQ